MNEELEAAARRRIHEALCRIAQSGGIPARQIDVPWIVDAILQLQEDQLSVGQALVLGTYLVGAARGAVSEQAASN